MDTLDHDEMRAASRSEFGGLVTIKLDSCNCTWYFQPVRMRFRRELKGIGISGVRTGWRPYYGLRFDGEFDRFTVNLDPEGTRLLSSWCHPPESDVCANCADHPTASGWPGGTCQVVR